MSEHDNLLQAYVDTSNKWRESSKACDQAWQTYMYWSDLYTRLNHANNERWKEVERALAALEAFNADTINERH